MGSRLTLEDILYAMQHPIDSARGTINEFTNSMQRVGNYGNIYPDQTAPVQQVAQPVGLQQQQAVQPPVQPPSLYQQAMAQLQPQPQPQQVPKKKKRLTPEEELKVTSQAGQLAILDQGY